MSDWTNERVLTVLGEYRCSFTFFGNWPDAETWEQVARSLAAIDGPGQSWWRVRWAMRRACYSVTLTWGPITAEPALYDFADWVVDANDPDRPRTYRETAALVHGGVHVFADVLRLWERPTVLVHELMHVADHCCGFTGRSEVRDRHAELAATERLSGIEKLRVKEWFATAGEHAATGRHYPGSDFVFDQLAGYR